MRLVARPNRNSPFRDAMMPVAAVAASLLICAGLILLAGANPLTAFGIMVKAAVSDFSSALKKKVVPVSSGSGRSSSFEETNSMPCACSSARSSFTLPSLWVATTSLPGWSLRLS